MAFNGTTMTVAAGTPIVFTVSNGIYTFFAHGHGRHVLVGVPPEGTITVDGANVAMNLPFTHGPTYDLGFHEKGLAPGTIWCVTVVAAQCAAAPALVYWNFLSPGTYSYAVGPQGLATTVVTVKGAPVGATGMVTLGPTVVFQVRFGYYATFVESGLPIGSVWSVTVGHTTLRSATPTIAFDLLDGTYAYTVHGATGYGPTVGSGHVTVNRFDVTQPVSFVQLIPSHPYGVAYDSAMHEVFVANSGLNDVSVISDATDLIVANIPVGSKPAGVAYDPAMGEIFVANYGSNSVSVISDLSNTVVATVKVGTGPFFDAYDSALDEIFVPNSGTSNVSVISGASNTVVATVSVGNGPEFAAYDPSTSDIYVSSTVSGTVCVISDATNSVVAVVTVGSAAMGLAFDPTRDAILVAVASVDAVKIISAVTNTVVGTVPVGTDPLDVSYDSGRGPTQLYVSNFVSGTVTEIFNGTSIYVPDTNPTGVGSYPIGLAYDSGLGEEFVANAGSNNVMIIRELTDHVIATIAT